MPSEQSNSNSKITAKKITVYAAFTAIALLFAFIESLFFPNFIPGVKLGLANTVCLILMLSGKTELAVTANIIRILATTLVFGNPFSLLYSLSGAALSMLAAFLLKNARHISLVGTSIICAAVHNIAQIGIAILVLSTVQIIIYLPVLLLFAAIFGGALGFFSLFLIKKCGKLLKYVV